MIEPEKPMPPIDEAEKDLVRQGYKIQAIKHYRERHWVKETNTGPGLRESKAVIDAHADTITGPAPDAVHQILVDKIKYLEIDLVWREDQNKRKDTQIQELKDFIGIVFLVIEGLRKLQV